MLTFIGVVALSAAIIIPFWAFWAPEGPPVLPTKRESRPVELVGR